MPTGVKYIIPEISEALKWDDVARIGATGVASDGDR